MPDYAVQRTHGGATSSLPVPILNLAKRLAERHGDITVALETGGTHLYMACPACLSKNGRQELRKRHLAVNADKYCMLGMHQGEYKTPGQRDRSALCMKCDEHYKVSDLLQWPTLAERDIKDSQAGQVRTVDSSVWIIKDSKGNSIPGGPGDGTEGSVIPVNKLARTHPAAAYLLQRGYDLDSLYKQFNCSYCAREWSRDPTAGRFYTRLPNGFWDSPQGRIIFFAFVNGVQVSWQARIIDHEFVHDGRRYKAFWNGHTNTWATMETYDEDKRKFVPLPQYAEGNLIWKPSKYRTAQGTSRNSVLFGYDAAVEWNREHRTGKLPVAFTGEGPLDAGRIGPPAVARIGKFMSDAQISLLESRFTHVVDVPDADEAGRKGRDDTQKRLAAKLEAHMWDLDADPELQGCKDIGDVAPEIVQRKKQEWLDRLS
jgi:hypothetical protein